MADEISSNSLDRRKKPRWNLPWWGYLLTLTGIFFILAGAASIIYN